VAVLFPERLPSSAWESERRVFDALARDLDDTYTVFHSLRWHQPGSKVDGEADFLIAHPQLGMLVMEVKGGGIDFDARSGTWTSRNRKGEEHRIEDPFNQALTAKHALIRELKAQAAWPPRRGVQIGYAVAFPDIHITASGFTSLGKREFTLGKNDLPSIGTAIAGSLAYWREADPSDSPGKEGIRALVERYGKSWTYRIPLKEAIAPEEQRIVELTDQQMSVLTMLSRHARAAIGGCAGSGKTLLAVEKARQMAARGEMVLLTCYNRPLADHWEASLDLPPGILIRNFHRLCKDAVARYGITPERAGMSGDDYMAWLPDGLLKAAIEHGLRFDGIVIDEGQDFEPDWLDTLQMLLRDRERSAFYLFYDDNQRLYRDAPIPAWLGEPYALQRNIRNTDQIGTLVRHFYDGDMELSGIDGRQVQLVEVPPDADGTPGSTLALRRVLKDIRDQGADPADVVVLGVSRAELDSFRNPGGWTPRTKAHPRGDVLLETIHSFKGRDSAIVVLTGLDHLSTLVGTESEERLEMLLYVGASRARSLLIMLVAPVLIPYLTAKFQP
jgi:hypothetical protein